jgi:predicted site-specific integrase-resolvase
MTVTALPEPLLNLEQAAQLLGYTHWSLRLWAKDGRLRCIRLGRRIMIEPAEVRRLIDVGRETHGQEIVLK